MKILVGCLFHESNTFNPFSTGIENFTLLEGEEVLDRLASVDVFLENGFEVIPSIFASGLPSGELSEETFEFLVKGILDKLKNNTDIDGIWLHLHGSMSVKNIGSGELELLKRIRHIVGDTIPISITLDIHANIPDDFCDYANIIRGYRSVPHVDQPETEVITANLLVESLLKKRNISPVYKKLPFIIGGDTAIGSDDPLKSIFVRLAEIESMDGILSASFFIGFSWADTSHMGSSIIIIPESKEYINLANTIVEELESYIDSRKEEFTFQSIALDPKSAIEYALKFDGSPVFISDTGDNTTGGAVGINTELLQEVMDQKHLGNKKICIASIFDEDAYEICSEFQVNDLISLQVGINYDKYSEPVTLTGKLKVVGDLLGFTSDKVGGTYTITVGNIDVVIANKAESFITVNHFTKAGLNIDDYDVVVVKQGYLFPELSKLAALNIFALTQGATYQYFHKLNFENARKDIYPFNNN